MKKSTKNKVFTIIILLALLGSSLAYAIVSSFPTQNQVQTNWRALLVIRTFGDVYPIPANIGIIDNQTRAKFFTINSDGIIYKTGEEDATLGEFFKIWGENFNRTCILNYCNNGNSSMKMYVNYVENNEYGNYVIKNNNLIIIDYR